MFGPKFKHYLETKREHYGAFLVAETHVIQSKADGVNIGMKKAGWRCYMSHSQQVLDESKKGPKDHGEGGTMAGALAHMQSSTVSEWHAGYMIEDFAPMILNIKGCSVCMIAAYLRPGIGLGGRNASRMQMMAAFVSMIRMPWAIYADWNVEPADMEKSGWVTIIAGELIRPEGMQFTCLMGSKRLIDYLIVSRDMEPMIKSFVRDPESPHEGHLSLDLELDVEIKPMEGWQLHVPAPPQPRVYEPKGVDPDSKASRQKLREGKALPKPEPPEGTAFYVKGDKASKAWTTAMVKVACEGIPYYEIRCPLRMGSLSWILTLLHTLASGWGSGTKWWRLTTLIWGETPSLSDPELWAQGSDGV